MTPDDMIAQWRADNPRIVDAWRAARAAAWRDPMEDARTIVVRDPGFAAWILVRGLRIRLRRACRWCLQERSKRLAMRIILRAKAGLSRAPVTQ
jgi:hypothetical protein